MTDSAAPAPRWRPPKKNAGDSDTRPPSYDETVRVSPAPSSPSAPTMPAAPQDVGAAPAGSRFGKFVCTEKLGAGGMGEVWKAWDGQLGRWVALKFLKGGDQDLIVRFQREAQLAGQLNHPNIAAIYDVGQDQGRLYIAMQFVDGGTLKDVPKSDRRSLVGLVRDAARAVHAAHERGIVHRDLKPENLMVTSPGAGRDRHVYVMDFGLARGTEGASNVSVAGSIVGTPAYMSPEQALGARADARSDVYSLGATLYEMLARRKPFGGASVPETLRRVQEDEPVAPRSLDTSIDRDLETIVLRCLEKRPDRRYATAADLSDDLERYLEGEPIQARRATPGYRLRKRLAKSKALAVAVTACVVLGAVAVGVGVRMSRQSAERAQVERARVARDAAGEKVREFNMAVATQSGRRIEMGREAAQALEAALAIDPEHAPTWVALGRCRKQLGGDPLDCFDRALAVQHGYGEALLERGRLKLERSQSLREAASPDVQGMKQEGERDLAAARSAGLAEHLVALLDAIIAFSRGEWAEAGVRASIYLDRAGWDADAFCLRGLARAALKDHEGAEADLDRAATLGVTNVTALFQRGLIRLARGRPAEAEADFTIVIEGCPDHAPTYANRGGARLDQGRYAEAEADFNEYIRRKETADAFRNRAILYERWGRADAAERDYLSAVERAPRDLPLILLLATFYYGGRKYAESRKAVDRAFALDPSSVEAHYRRARIDDDEGQIPAAESGYEAALKLDPRHSASLVGLALLARGKRDYVRMEDLLARALAVNPADIYALNARGLAQRDRGRMEDSLRDFGEALRLNPRFVDALNGRGNTLAFMGRYDQAEKDYSLAIGIAPRDGLAWGNRGLARLQLGRLDEAERDLEESVRLDPRNSSVYTNLAVVFMQRRDWVGAERVMDRGVQTVPQAAGVYETRGKIRALQKRWKDAMADYDRAVQLDPSAATRLAGVIAEARRALGGP